MEAHQIDHEAILAEAVQKLAAHREAMAIMFPLYGLYAKEEKERAELVRELALAEYERTHEEDPYPGVEIQQYKRVDGADTPEMLDWCMHKAQNLVQVNQAEAKKQAKHLISTGAPMKLSYEPRVRIATDLDKAFRESKERAMAEADRRARLAKAGEEAWV